MRSSADHSLRKTSLLVLPEVNIYAIRRSSRSKRTMLGKRLPCLLTLGPTGDASMHEDHSGLLEEDTLQSIQTCRESIRLLEPRRCVGLEHCELAAVSVRQFLWIFFWQNDDNCPEACLATCPVIVRWSPACSAVSGYVRQLSNNVCLYLHFFPQTVPPLC